MGRSSWSSVIGQARCRGHPWCCNAGWPLPALTTLCCGRGLAEALVLLVAVPTQGVARRLLMEVRGRARGRAAACW